MDNREALNRRVLRAIQYYDIPPPEVIPPPPPPAEADAEAEVESPLIPAEVESPPIPE